MPSKHVVVTETESADINTGEHSFNVTVSEFGGFTNQDNVWKFESEGRFLKISHSSGVEIKIPGNVLTDVALDFQATLTSGLPYRHDEFVTGKLGFDFRSLGVALSLPEFVGAEIMRNGGLNKVLNQVVWRAIQNDELSGGPDARPKF
jgi:hypothetical protein